MSLGKPQDLSARPPETHVQPHGQSQYPSIANAPQPGGWRSWARAISAVILLAAVAVLLLWLGVPL